MDTAQENNSPPKQKSTDKHSHKFLIVVMFVTAVTTAVMGQKLYFRWFNKNMLSIQNYPMYSSESKETTISNETDTVPPEPTEGSTKDVLTNFRVEANQYGTRYLIYYPTKKNSDECYFKVTNKYGHYANSMVDLGVDVLPCSSWQYLSMDAFKGWAGNKAVFVTETGRITSIDTSEFYEPASSEVFEYDSEKLMLKGFDESLSRLVYQVMDTGEDVLTYEFLNPQGETVLSSATFNTSLFDVEYDSVNRGLFFIHRLFNPEGYADKDGLGAVLYEIYYLADDSQEMEKVFEHIGYVGGRGCGPADVVSTTVGEFRYSTGGCLAIQGHPGAVDANTLVIDLE